MHTYVIHPPKQVLLDHVAIRAAEVASLALTKWFGHEVRIHTNGFAKASTEEVSTMIGGGESPVVAVHTHMDGSLSGHVLLAFPEDTAGKIVSMLTGEPAGEPGQFGDLAQSALCETANIVSSAFINSLSQSLNVRAIPSPPSFRYDLGAALIEPLAAEQLEVSSGILYVSASFEIAGAALDWWLYVVPSPECMQVMVALLH